MSADFEKFLQDNYQPMQGLALGRPQYQEKIFTDYQVKIPLNVLTRHGLITGSTGTGKSRAIQLMIESLNLAGVPVLLSDIKGDMSGFNLPGDANKVSSRASKLNYNFSAQSFNTNYWGTSEDFVGFRINLSDIDYVIIARLLDLNTTQESHLGAVFKYAVDNKIKLNTLKDLKELVLYFVKYPEKNLGSNKESMKVISRKIDNLLFSNFDKFFGRPDIEVADLLTDKINILWLQNYQKEKFNVGNMMACLLNKLYNDLPEIGDTAKPNLVIFIDEAHQIFENANPSLVRLLVQILKQIRSKGVGIIFNTQNADSIPEEILEQLGLKVQFALRSFSLKELQEISGVVESFPASAFYNMKEEIKSLETGTAFVSTLNEKGALLAPVKTVIFPPASFMDAVPRSQLAEFGDSNLKEKYFTLTNTKPLDLGSPLDNITVTRGGKWQMSQYLERKEDQKIRRQVNKQNKSTARFFILIIAILGLIALIVLLIVVLSLLAVKG